MYNFTYVSKKEAAPYKEEIIKLIQTVQKEIKKHFTFRFDFIGSSSRNMITCEKNRNIGYDFDVNIEPNDPDENYNAGEIRTIIFEAIRKHMQKFGYSKIENSTSVITIKAIDRKNSRIEHSCDFAIVFSCGDGRKQYIKYNKRINKYSWEYRGNNYNIDDKLKWILSNNFKLELCERYLNYKNRNNNPEKHSRTIFAEAVNDLYNEKRYRFK
ncbi:MAG: hypothetical protein K2O36_05695 [Ruminococcus sp.]|nr:hypothetical protein [Ruminococcus sp.]